MSKSLEGKVAVITGGGQGVGLGIAQKFVEQALDLLAEQMSKQCLSCHSRLTTGLS